MTEDELDQLKSLPVPAASKGARAAALAAGLAAFGRAAAENAAAPQGRAVPPRLRDMTSISEGSSRMRFRRPAAIAASIVVLALIVPSTAYLLLTQQFAHRVEPQDKLAEKPREEQVAALPAPVPPTEAAPKPVESAPVVPPATVHPEAETTPGISVQAPPPADSKTGAGSQKKEASQDADQLIRFGASTKFGSEPPAPPSAKAPSPPATTAAPSPPEKSASAPTIAGSPPVDAKAKAKQVVVGGAPKEARRADIGPLAPVRGFSSGGFRGVSQDSLPHLAEKDRDRFTASDANAVKSVASEPVSTFSIDVDIASYAFVRRALNAGNLPPKEAVRVEEMINYFPYDYPLPEDKSAPFRPTVSVLPAPWNPANKLIHIAIKGFDVAKAERPRANLVLLIDTSGSMSPEDRLPLIKNAFRMLIDTLRPDDTVGIVTYAGGTQVALEPTKVADKRKILEAIERLQAGGSTAGGAGIQEAYRMAEGALDKTAVNRVILATDGDFNVGITSVDELKSFIERKRETGIYLSVLGVGRGNYNDALMQALAQNGNGVAAYIDTLNEARKILVDEVSSTLFPIAKDVKIQVEFNPAQVTEYRLIGYETRLLKREDFNNDKVDAGDIGSGHTVTAIYEVTPVGSPRFVEDLRYKQPAVTTPKEGTGEYAFLRINYKLPTETVSRRIELPITQALEKASIDQIPTDVRFSVAVAAFGQLLRSEPYLKAFGYDEVIALAASARGEDLFGYRAELLNLVRLAKTARP
jgi:Ca-activated chloride channel homolog